MAFIGIRVPHETARLLGQIEVSGDREPVDHMHITMMYLGKNVPVEQLARCVEATYAVTSRTTPFTVATKLVTNFPRNPDSGIPIIARIESDPLHALQAALKESFNEHDVPFSDKYPEYKPHVTLAYLKDENEHPVDREIPPVVWGVGEIVLWGGDTGDDKLVISFPFSLIQSKAAAFRGLVRLASTVPCARCSLSGRRASCIPDMRGALVCGSCGWSLWPPQEGIREAHTTARQVFARMVEKKGCGDGGCQGGCSSSCPCMSQKIVARYLHGK